MKRFKFLTIVLRSTLYALRLVRFPFNLINLLLVRYFPKYRRLPLYAQKTISTLLVFMVLLSSAYSYLFLIKPNQASAAWFDDSWAYRQRIPIDTHTAQETNVYNEMSIDTATLTTDKLQADCDDLRFTKENGQMLPYQIVSGCDSATTVIRVGFDVMPVAPFNIYMYYGNPSATARSQTLTHSACGNGCAEGSPASEEKAQSPVAYWKFDEGTDNTCPGGTNDACDSTQSGNHSPQSGAVVWKPESECLSGKCVYYSGATNSYFRLPDASQKYLDLQNTAFTLSAWIKHNAPGNNQGIIGKDARSDGNRGLLFRLDTNNNIAINISSTGTGYQKSLTGTKVVSANEWHQVVMVFNPSASLSIYVDGVLDTTDTSSIPATIFNNGAAFEFGTSNTGDLFKGYMDEVKVYQYALSASQIKNNYNSRAAESGAVLGISDANENFSNGLVGYWKMDESSWTSDCSTEEVLDASGNGNNGESCPNGAANDPLAGKFGNGGDFDGSNDYVSVDNTSSLDPGTGDISVSVWVKPDTITDTQTGIVRYVNGNSYYILEHHDDDRMQLEFRDGTCTSVSLLTTTTLTASVWNHIVLTIDRDSQAAIYINGGTPATSTNVTTCQASITGGTINFGRHVNYFDGVVDETRIYNRTLSPQEVSQLYNFAPGPVGYWDFNEGSGTSAFDKSGNSLTGTFTNSPSWGTGKYGKGVTFTPSSNQYVSVADNSLIEIGSGSYTVGGWMKTSITGSTQNFIRKDDGSGQNGFLFQISGSNVMTWRTGDADSFGASNSSSNITDGRWHYIVGIYNRDNDTQYLYVDGVLQDSDDPNITGTVGNNNTLKIGDWATESRPVNAIDEVKIYNYARTAQQIVEDMNAGHPAPGSPVGSPVGYWKFDEGADNTCSGGTNDFCNSGSYGSSADGAVVTSVTPATSTSGWQQAGKYGKAFAVDGSNDYSTIPDITSVTDFSYNEDFSVSFWIKDGGGNSDSDAIVEKWAGGSGVGYPFVFRYNNGSVQLAQYNGTTSAAVTGTKAINDSMWHHIVGIKSTVDSKLYLYIDGIPFNTSNTLTGTTTNSSGLHIGSRGGTAGTFYSGIIDELKIYNSALTADQVKLDMNQGASQVLGVTGTTSTGSPDSSAAREFCVPGDSSTCNAPVGEWDFNEGSGTSAFDKSGNGYTGTWNGTTTNVWTTGKAGKAGKFNGTDNFVNVNPITLNYTQSYTLSAWINPAQLGNQLSNCGDKRAYIVSTLDGSNFVETELFSSGNLFYRHTATPSNLSITSSTIFTTNRWYHIAVQYNQSANTMSMYVDGVLQGTPTSTSGFTLSNPSAGALKFGYNTHNCSNSYFQGNIDNIKIYNYARTPAQIAWDFNKGAPVGWWKFDECQGTTAYDDSRNGNNATNGNNGTITIGGSGTQTSAGTCSTSSTAWGNGVTGKRNASLNFDGDDYANTADSSLLEFATGDFSMGGWIYRTSGSTIIAKGDGGSATGTEYVLAVNGQGFWFRGAWRDSSALDVSSSTWTHVFVTFTDSDDSLRIYINGVLADTLTSITGSYATTTSTGVYFAKQGSGALNYFIGQLDDMRIYNYALTATQVKTLYSDGAVNFR